MKIGFNARETATQMITRGTISACVIVGGPKKRFVHHFDYDDEKSR